jgi:hypothetical protein
MVVAERYVNIWLWTRMEGWIREGRRIEEG